MCLYFLFKENTNAAFVPCCSPHQVKARTRDYMCYEVARIRYLQRVALNVCVYFRSEAYVV